MDDGPFLEVKTKTGSGILIPLVEGSIDEDAPEWQDLGPRDLLKVSLEDFSERLEGLSDILSTVRDRAVGARPSEIEVQVGLKFTVGGNLFIATGEGEASLNVTVRWDLRKGDAKSEG